MNIDEKVLQLKQDFDEVYEAGKATGGGSGEEYLRYAKTVQFNSLNDFGKAEVELNLDKCTTLLNLCSITSAENRNNTIEHLTINCANPTFMNSMLNCGYQVRDEKLKRLTLNMNTSNVTNFSNAFNCLTALEEIDGTPLDLSSATTVNNMFNYNNALKKIRFVEKSIPISISFSYVPSISDETIQSIIDGLLDLSEYYLVGTEIDVNIFEYTDSEIPLSNVTKVSIDTNCTMSDGASVYNVTSDGYVLSAYKKVSNPQRLSLHADIKTKLTDEQKTTITDKGWILA